MSSHRILQAAFDAHNAGRLDEARRLYRKVIKADRSNPDANHLLGVVEYQLGNLSNALKLIKTAMNANQSNPAYSSNCGLVLQQLGRLDEAIACFKRSLELHPGQFDALYNLGNIYIDKLDYAKAKEVYGKALTVSPGHPKALNGLGNALTGLGDLLMAVDAYTSALEADPNYVLAMYNHASACEELGDNQKAEAGYGAVIKTDPGFVEAHVRLGNMQRDTGRLDAAVMTYQNAFDSGLENEALYIKYGEALSQQDKPLDAINVYRNAREKGDCYFPALWGEMLTLPILYDSEEHIETSRSRWFEGVNRLLEEVDLESEQGISDAKMAAGMFTNFYLNYQGRDDLDAQLLYGDLLSRISHAAYPQYSNFATRDIKTGTGKIRIGFVSSFFYNHSIYKTHGRWITGLDRNKFDVYVYYSGVTRDWATAEISQRTEKFVAMRNVENLIAVIADDDLDILIYPDLGMDPKLQLISALRLACVQCNGGGHPVTSGLKSIDYFISSDLMEPDDGHEQYSEVMVRLNHLASAYPYPDTESSTVPMTVSHEQGSPIYANLQSLFKILPQHDCVYPRIAKEVPDCQFWFVSGMSTHVTDRFRQRLKEAFSKEGMNYEEYCVIHPRMSQKEFFGLAGSADIILDGIAWSGNNSSLEALAFDKPIVTMPGTFFRNRHTFGILKRIGVEDTIAYDIDGYIAKAIQLGTDRQYRQEIVEKVSCNKHIAYDDDEVVRGLEQFLISVARG